MTRPGLSPYRDLVAAHARSLFRVAYRIVGTAHDAEDIAQEALFRSYRQLSSYETDQHFAASVHRIASNLAIDHVRKRKRWKTQELDADVAPELPATTVDPARSLASDEIGARVERALDLLTAKERAAFTLRHYEGCSMREIADLTESTVNTTKNRVFRAVQKMRGALAPLLENAR